MLRLIEMAFFWILSISWTLSLLHSMIDLNELLLPFRSYNHTHTQSQNVTFNALPAQKLPGTKEKKFLKLFAVFIFIMHLQKFQLY